MDQFTEQFTEDEAVRFFDSRAWEPMEPRDRAIFQLGQERLCMPFPVFHKAVEDALGRPVFTHEFGLNRDGLLAQLKGEAPAATFRDVVDLIPAEKRIIVVVPDGTNPTHGV